MDVLVYVATPSCQFINATYSYATYYKSPVFEFGRTVFSGLPNYRLALLMVLGWRDIRLSVGLPRYVANNVLYCMSCIPCVQSRFWYLTVSAHVHFYHWSLVCSQRNNIFRLENLSPLSCTRPRTTRLNFASNLLIFMGSSLSEISVSFMYVRPFTCPSIGYRHFWKSLYTPFNLCSSWSVTRSFISLP